MCYRHVKEVIIFLFLHAVMSFGEQNPNSDADIINTCVNTAWCSHSYEQVYKSLAKAENNFNISHALYPGRSKPASVRVLVSVFRSHKTDASIKPAVYTWSMSCLFVSIPAAVLEFLSLSSILVTPRTQELIIHIPQFCCNVSESSEGRKMVIDEMLTRALAELEDLAISPGIQDPRLNTAECVIQGHQPNIDATGVNSYIRAILYCSLFSVLLIGPILGFFSLTFFGNDPSATEKDNFKCCAKRHQRRDGAPEQGHDGALEQGRDGAPEQGHDGAPEQGPSPTSILCKYDCCCCCNERVFKCYKIEDPFTRPAKYICHLLVMTEFSIIIVISDALCDHKEIFSHIVLIICEGAAVCLVQRFPRLCCVCCEGSSQTSFYRRAVFITSANIITYHLCWLIVGIMVNPTWGLTVLAVACSVIVALFCTIYLICSASQEIFCHRFCASIASFVGFCLVVSLTVVAGKSFNGKETTGEILKTALFYVVGGLIGLLGKGFLGSSSGQRPPPSASPPSPPPPPPRDRATQRQSQIELEAVNEEARQLIAPGP